MTALAQQLQYLIVGATNDIDLSHPTVPPMIDTATGLPVTNATGTMTLYDSTDGSVAGAIGLAVAFVAGVPGFAARYRSVLPSSVVLVPNASYTAKMTMTDSLGNVRPFWVPCLAVRSIPVT